MITLLVMTDGRDDLLDQTLPLAAERIPHSRLVIHDDTGSLEHRELLHERFADLTPDIIGGSTRRGFGGAIQAAWAHIATMPEPFVWHLEDDFLLTRELDMDAMIDVLDAHPNLLQLALRRQPWNPDEKAAGGIIEQHPGDYLERSWASYTWLEHRRFFTTNPSLYRRNLCLRSWPDGGNSEGHFGQRIIAENTDARFGYWGARDSGEWCHHIGVDRVGTGY